MRLDALPPSPCETLKGMEEGHRSEEHTSELQSHSDLVCRLLLVKKKPGLPRRRPRGPRLQFLLRSATLLAAGRRDRTPAYLPRAPHRPLGGELPARPASPTGRAV